MATVDARIAHIWRRLGFSGTRAELDAAKAIGTTRLITSLLDRPLVPFADNAIPDGGHTGAIRQLEVMAFGPSPSGAGTTSPQYNPLQERVTWLLQGLVVTGIVDSVYAPDVRDHISVLSAALNTDYRSLLTAISTRSGMLKYLTGHTNTRDHPNQNFGRELLELFSLGRVHHATGVANYSEADVVEVSKALSGWRYNWGNATTYFQASEWDNGTKTFLGGPRGAAGLNEVIAAICEQPTWRTYVPIRLYRDIVGLTPTPDTVTALSAAWGANGSIKTLIRAIARRPEFLSDASIRSKTKSPLERIVAATRLLQYPALSTNGNLSWWLGRLGQHPWIPPNVSGWPRGDQWLNASNLQTWSELANSMTMRGFIWDGSTNGPISPTITQLHQEATAATAATRATQLAGLTPVGARTLNALTAYASAGTWTPARAGGVLNLVLLSPEFLAN